MKTKSRLRQAKYIGIDVGGTKILLQTFDARLTVMDSKKIMTDVRHGRVGFLKQLFSLIDEFFNQDIKGIGVAVPGIVEAKRGVLVHAPHLPTGKNLALKNLLKKRYKTAIAVDNDINAFLAEESRNIKLKNYKNILVVLIGTGVGGAVMTDGKILYGKEGFAGEFGHMVIDRKTKLKTLEENVGGYYLKKYPRLKKDLTSNLGVGLANLNLIFNPEAIVLGGSVYEHYLADKKAQLKRVIASHSLNKRAPILVDAASRRSAARGIVLLLNQ